MDFAWSMARIIFSASIAGAIATILVILTKAILGRRMSSTWHHLIWFIVVARLLIPIVPTSRLSVFNLLPASHTWLVVQNTEHSNANGPYRTELYSKDNNPSDTGDVPLQNITLPDQSIHQSLLNESRSKAGQSFHWSSILQVIAVIVWLAGILGVYGWIYIAYRKLLRKLHCFSPCKDERILGILSRCAEELNTKKAIPIYTTSEVLSPYVFGVIKPAILLPQNLILCDDQQLRHILLHEIAHIRRGDNVINLLLIILQGLHWYNPLIWLAFKHMRRDTEPVCDARVMTCLSGKENHSYAETLVYLAQASFTHIAPIYIGFAEHKSNLRKRVENIMSQRKRPFSSMIIGIMILSILGMVACTSPAQSQGHLAITPDPNSSKTLNTSTSPEQSQNEAEQQKKDEFIENSKVEKTNQEAIGKVESTKSKSAEKPIEKAKNNVPVFGKNDLKFSKLAINQSTPQNVEAVLGQPQSKKDEINQASGQNMLFAQYKGLELGFSENKGKFLLTSAVIKDTSIAGPRGIQVGNSIESVIGKFPSQAYKDSIKDTPQVLYAYKNAKPLQVPCGTIEFTTDGEIYIYYLFSFVGAGKAADDMTSPRGILSIVGKENKVTEIRVLMDLGD